MKRVFSRKRKDYKLFAAALAFGFTLTVAIFLLSDNSSSTSSASGIVREEASSSTRTETIAFAYASQMANNVNTSDASPAPVLQASLPQASAPQLKPVARQHYIKSAPVSMTEIVAITKGDTLDQILESFDIPKNTAVEAIDSLKGIFSPRQFKIGQQITLLFRPTQNGGRDFLGYRFAADTLRDVIVLSDDDKGIFDATVVTKELKNVITAKEGHISGSLVGAASRAGVPYSIVSEMIRVYSYSIDFQRDIHEGDKFEVMYESQADKTGRVHNTGDMLFARLVLSGKDYPLYRYKSPDGHIDYYKEDGTSNRRGLIRTPIDGARMSSGFGMRRHPILGYSKMHKGIDFAAPTGTPIYAAGDGVIKTAGWVNGYGKFVKLTHNASLSTGYGHMSRFASGIRPGVRVRQGQIIGYVGMTGRATGPHLHYEVMMGGAQVNPVGVKVPTASQLAGADLKKFKQAIGNQEASFKQALIASRIKTASR